MTLELSSHVNWSHQARYPLPSRLTVMSRTPLEGGDPAIGLSSVPCQGLFSDCFLPALEGGVDRTGAARACETGRVRATSNNFARG